MGDAPDRATDARDDREPESSDTRSEGNTREELVSRALEKVGQRVYVGNLSWDTRWQGLKDHMRTAGEVLHAEVFKDGSGRSAGCGIVEFESRADAENAIRTMNDSTLDGRTIFIREDREEGKPRSSRAPRERDDRHHHHRERDHHRGDRDRGDRSYGGGDYSRSSRGRDGGGGRRKIVVWNLPYHMRWQQLKDIFRDTGDVVRADVPLHPDGKSKGMGTVMFERSEDAERAIEEWSGKTIEGRVVDVRYDKFE